MRRSRFSAYSQRPCCAAPATVEDLGSPTTVLLLRNMVGPGEVDVDLEDEAGGVVRTSTRPTLRIRASSGHLYEHQPRRQVTLRYWSSACSQWPSCQVAEECEKFGQVVRVMIFEAGTVG